MDRVVTVSRDLSVEGPALSKTGIARNLLTFRAPRTVAENLVDHVQTTIVSKGRKYDDAALPLKCLSL